MLVWASLSRQPEGHGSIACVCASGMHDTSETTRGSVLRMTGPVSSFVGLSASFASSSVLLLQEVSRRETRRSISETLSEATRAEASRDEATSPICDALRLSASHARERVKHLASHRSTRLWIIDIARLTPGLKRRSASAARAASACVASRRLWPL